LGVGLPSGRLWFETNDGAGPCDSSGVGLPSGRLWFETIRIIGIAISLACVGLPSGRLWFETFGKLLLRLVAIPRVGLPSGRLWFETLEDGTFYKLNQVSVSLRGGCGLKPVAYSLMALLGIECRSPFGEAVV